MPCLITIPCQNYKHPKFARPVFSHQFGLSKSPTTGPKITCFSFLSHSPQGIKILQDDIYKFTETYLNYNLTLFTIVNWWMAANHSHIWHLVGLSCDFCLVLGYSRCLWPWFSSCLLNFFNLSFSSYDIHQLYATSNSFLTWMTTVNPKA